MKNNLFVCMAALMLLLLSIFGFTNKTTSDGGIATMRTVEVRNSLCESSITIAYEDGKTEKYELKSLAMGGLTKNVPVINEHLNKIRSKGYKMISTLGVMVDGMVITNYTFEKE